MKTAKMRNHLRKQEKQYLNHDESVEDILKNSLVCSFDAQLNA